MTVEQLLENYTDYHIMVFPKGRVNTPVKHVERFYDREVKDYVNFDALKVLFIYTH